MESRFMKQKGGASTSIFLALIAVLAAAVLGVSWYQARWEINGPNQTAAPTPEPPTPTPTPTPPTPTPLPAKVLLEVPYISEVPDGILKGPWKNACEEASITMVEKYYAGEKSVGVSEAKAFMQVLFGIEDKLFGSNANTDAARNAQLINKYTSYGASIHENPTVEDIKYELRRQHPVISMYYGFELHNKNIPFLPTGSAYHAMVVIGYDDASGEFITNDPGDLKEGAGHRYDYDIFMNSLHDYDYSQKKANGPPRVIFTYPKN